MNPAPIFIGGVNRSGTSLMRQLIGSHSQVAIPPTEFGFFRNLSNPQDPIEDQAEFIHMVEEVLTWPKVAGWGLSKDKVLTAAREAESTYRGLFLLILDHYRKLLNKARIGEKSTHYERHLDIFDEWFGGGYNFIHLIRHPADTYASQRWYMGTKRDINVGGWASAWVKSVHIGLRRSFTHRHRYRVVRYEDLVSDPEGVLGELCEFLELEFEKERMFSMADYDQKDNSSFKEVADQKTYDGLIRQNDDLDRVSMLSDDEVKAIAALCGPTAELVGYDLDSADVEQDGCAIRATSALDQLPMGEMVRLMASYVPSRVWSGLRRRFLNI